MDTRISTPSRARRAGGAHPTRRTKHPVTEAKADRSAPQRQADLDGYLGSPVLSFAPPTYEPAAKDLVRRWETGKRYFETRIERDIFNTPILLAANGGKGTRLGAMRVVAVGEQIPEALQAIARKREAHGYRLVS